MRLDVEEKRRKYQSLKKSPVEMALTFGTYRGESYGVLRKVNLSSGLEDQNDQLESV